VTDISGGLAKETSIAPTLARPFFLALTLLIPDNTLGGLARIQKFSARTRLSHLALLLQKKPRGRKDITVYGEQSAAKKKEYQSDAPRRCRRFGRIE
jgi:hypothetical protein